MPEMRRRKIKNLDQSKNGSYFLTCLFTSLKEMQTYIEECEQKRLNLDNEEGWSQAYLPATRTTQV